MPTKRPTAGRLPFGIQPHLTFDEVGEILGLTRQRIQAVERQALRKLRHALEAEGLGYQDLAGGERRVKAREARATL